MSIPRYRIVIILLIVILLSTIGLFSSWFLHHDKVLVHTIKAEKLENNRGSNFSGKLEALETAAIVSKISGKVATINVDLGSAVKAGDTLLTLEAHELAASVEQARANVEIAYSSLETAQIDYAVQRQNLERNKALVEQGALARADFDNKYALPFAKAKELALNGASAQVRQTEANLQLARANYQNTIIVSPISGIIAEKSVNIGELASPNVLLFSVINFDKVFMMASVEAEEINQIQIGDQLPVKIAAVSTIPFNGLVTNIAQASGSASKTYLVKVLVDNQDHRLKPGMFAEIQWKENPEMRIVVPKITVISKNGKTCVWTVKDGIVSCKEVSVESVDVINAVIKSGIEAGEDIVSSGQEMLTEGMPVMVSR